jgi:colanic acid/amylovoran biosynthesis glycosyltransferase
MDVCFRLTETFVYDFVRGCKEYEAWCVANVIDPQPGLDFERVRCVRFRWKDNPIGGTANRVLGLFLRLDNARLYRSLVRLNPTVIHAHFGPAGCEVLPYARRLGVPLLTSFYGYDASSLPRLPGWADRLRRLFDEGTGFLVEGPAMARRLEATGCPAEKIHLLPITIDPDRYTSRPRYRDRSQPLRLLFVGRFVPKKGLPVLLHSLALARNAIGSFDLRVIGGGPGEEEARRLTSDLGLEPSVQFLGYQPRAEVLREMDQAHVLAAPSQTAPDGDTEGGAPTILLEAQASGLPVLTTDHADIPFVVSPSYRPYLAIEGSATSMADRLVALCADASRWSALAEEARAHVAVQHGPANYHRLEQHYRDAALRADTAV